MHGWTNRSQSDAVTRTPPELERLLGSCWHPMAAFALGEACRALVELLERKRPRPDQPMRVEIMPMDGMRTLERELERFERTVEPATRIRTIH